MQRITLTTAKSPIAHGPAAGRSFPLVPPGGRVAVGIVLQGILGDQANGPLQEAFVANTYCTGTTAQLELIPGGFGGARRFRSQWSRVKCLALLTLLRKNQANPASFPSLPPAATVSSSIRFPGFAVGLLTDASIQEKLDLFVQ